MLRATAGAGCTGGSFAKTLSPVENLLRAAVEKDYPWFAKNTPLLHAVTGHELPGWL
jgi:hypothetical protein